MKPSARWWTKTCYGLTCVVRTLGMIMWPTGWEEKIEVFRYACRPTCVLHCDACVCVPVHRVNTCTGCVAGSKVCSEAVYCYPVQNSTTGLLGVFVAKSEFRCAVYFGMRRCDVWYLPTFRSTLPSKRRELATKQFSVASQNIELPEPQISHAVLLLFVD